jgi:ClpP class serine protease
MKWFIEAEALEEIKDVFAQADGSIVAAVVGQGVEPEPEEFAVVDGVAHIAVAGPLMARSNPILKFFGVQHTGYNDILAALSFAEKSPKVESIQLNVNSPGGQASGLHRVTDTIKALTKPVVSVADYAASAAYAIAAATGRIEAQGPASSFGSIGVAAEFAVDEKIVTITSTEAPDKRPDVTTEEGRAVIRSQLDAMHELFVSNIAESRGTTPVLVNETFGRGRSFLAEEARSRGMIDDIRLANGGPSESQKQSASAEEKNKMDLKTLKTEHPEVYSAACSEAVTKERDRVGAHLEMGTMSGDMKTALTAVTEGTEMTQTLNAKYMSAAMNKRDKQNRTDDDETADDALRGKVTNKGKEGEVEVSDFDREFAANLKSLSGVDCDISE